ncbi:MAG: PqiC family protein [Chthoniobacteraceae bacterium]
MILRILTPATALALAACSTPETYYRLNATGSVPTDTSGISIGVGPVNLPDYIDRSELVFQSDRNRFEVPYNQRWAGSLRETATRVLGTDLARRLGTGNLRLYPWDPGTPMRYQVRVEVRQFHAMSGGDAILQCAWVVEDTSRGKVVVRQDGNFTEPVRGDGYTAVVAAESRLLAQLADAIAATFPKK